MNWLEPVYIYCERANVPDFWAEPLNALSNGAFLLAAFVAYREWRHGGQPLPQAFLILGVAVTGIGSFLFHTQANAWSALADMVPIGILMISFLIFMQRRFLRASRPIAFLGIAVFLAAMAIAMQIRCDGQECLNGSVGYLPALAGLAVIGGVLLVRQHPAGQYLLGAAAVFAVSLVFRTLDMRVCASFPWGTHALWHLLNAGMLYILLIATLRHAGAPRMNLAKAAPNASTVETR